MKLLGDGRTADDAAAFEHEHLEAGFREVGSAHEAVVAGADQDRVVVLRGHETDYAVPPSSRRRPGSSFLGRQEIWIPAFAGMTRGVCDHLRHARTHGIRLRTVNATRYVTPLREGGSLP